MGSCGWAMKRTPWSVHSSVLIISQSLVEVGSSTLFVVRWFLHPMCCATIARNIRYRGTPADFTAGRNGKYHRPGLVVLRHVFRAHIASGEDGDERSLGRGPFYAGPSLGFLALHQAHRTDYLKPKFSRRFDGLNRRRTGGADIVDDHHFRALLAKTF